MENEEMLLKQIAQTNPVEADAVVDYVDEDFMMIDNVRLFSEPDNTRLHMNTLAFCTKGRMQANLNGSPIEFSEHQLLICPPNTSLDDFMISPDFELKVIVVSPRLLQAVLRERMNVWTRLLYLHKRHVVDLNAVEIDFVDNYYQMISSFVNGPKDMAFKRDITLSLLRAGFLGLCSFLLEGVPETESGEGHRQSDNLFQQFFDMLNSQSVKYHTVEYYADKLCITPKYLSSICKKNTGKTASDWIRIHVMEDIRYYLKFTDFSVKQVSDVLGFPNPSFFGKYVRTHFGMSPAKFRMG